MDRRAIATRVTTWSDDLVREAIIRELNRDGQVFLVHNRVRSIERIANTVRTLVPDARVIVGHGQMPGDELESVMLAFVSFSRAYANLGPAEGIPNAGETGQIFGLFIIAVAAAEAAVGLAIVVAYFKNRNTVDTRDIRSMHG